MDPFSGLNLVARQIWAEPTLTSGALPHTCNPIRLPSGGAINIGQGTIITLTQDAAFQPWCSTTPVPPPIDPTQPGVDLSSLSVQEPWYSSTTPQIFAISAVTIVSYMLVVILFITPRTFFVGGPGGGGGFLGSKGVVSGAYGSNSVIGIGGRPWLQKIAALSVAISMTIVCADTFKWARHQYHAGYEDSGELTIKVINGTEVRIVRVISETFLWLAQAQTLIRLFPRHKEKLIIKWIAFALIILELVFSIVNHFVAEESRGRPKIFNSAVSALNYLFAFTLNICYLGFVLYYVLSRRRHAFYHPYMRNMPLLALLSLTAVFIPVVFFVLDLSKPNVSGWGNYVRWVGSAAASVVVWEWVERIEALERDEKKGGILGREIFEGDEALDATPESDASWPKSWKKGSQRRNPNSGSGLGFSTGWISMTAKARGLGRSQESRRLKPLSGPVSSHSQQLSPKSARKTRQRISTNRSTVAAPPAAVTSPLSRGGSSSAESTLYVVHYHSARESDASKQDVVKASIPDSAQQPQRERQQSLEYWTQEEETENTRTSLATRRQNLAQTLQRIPNPFRRPRETPPPEVARVLAGRLQESDPLPEQPEKSDSTNILERLHLKKTPRTTGPPRPVIVVPAPPSRQGSWSNSTLDSTHDGNSRDDDPGRSQSDAANTSFGRDTTLQEDAVSDVVDPSRSVSPFSDDGSRNVQ